MKPGGLRGPFVSDNYSCSRWRARELGQGETAQRIEEAVERMAVCNEALAAALRELEK